MRINIDEIGEGGYDLEEKLSRAWLDGILSVDPHSLFSATGPAQLNAHLEKIEQSVLLRASTSPTLTTECGRCLKPVEITVPIAFTLSLVSAARAAGRQGLEADGAAPDAAGRGSFDPNQADEETYSGHSIDLEPLVREQILLALPMDTVCREGCKGICATCGQDLNERSCGCSQQTSDPRWEKLRSLKVSN